MKTLVLAAFLLCAGALFAQESEESRLVRAEERVRELQGMASEASDKIDKIEQSLADVNATITGYKMVGGFAVVLLGALPVALHLKKGK